MNRHHLVSAGAGVSVLLVAFAANALTYSGSGNVSVPDGASGDPDLVVTSTLGNVLFLGSANAQNLTVSASGTTTQASGGLAILGTASLKSTGNGAITLTNSSNDFALVGGNAGTGSISIVDQNGLVLGDTVAGQLAVSAAGSLSSSANATIAVGGSMTIDATAVVLGNGIDLSFGGGSGVAAGSLSIAGTLSIPALTTGVALNVQAPVASIAVTLNLGPLGFTPTTETRLHAFNWNGTVPSLSVTPGTAPVLPAGMTLDFSELGTSGDLVIRVSDAGAPNDAGASPDAASESDASGPNDAGALPDAAGNGDASGEPNDAGALPDAAGNGDASGEPNDAGISPDAASESDASAEPTDAGALPDAASEGGAGSASGSSAEGGCSVGATPSTAPNGSGPASLALFALAAALLRRRRLRDCA